MLFTLEICKTFKCKTLNAKCKLRNIECFLHWKFVISSNVKPSMTSVNFVTLNGKVKEFCEINS